MHANINVVRWIYGNITYERKLYYNFDYLVQQISNISYVLEDPHIHLVSKFPSGSQFMTPFTAFRSLKSVNVHFTASWKRCVLIRSECSYRVTFHVPALNINTLSLTRLEISGIYYFIISLRTFYFILCRIRYLIFLIDKIRNVQKVAINNYLGISLYKYLNII